MRLAFFIFVLLKITQKLEIPEKINSKEKLLDAISRGARFVVFQYCISPLAISLIRYSPAILLFTEEDFDSKSSSYNQLSRSFGWWSFPYGPRETLRSIRVNENGGVDITEDILLNFQESMFETQEIELTKTNQLFINPDSDVLQAFSETVKMPSVQNDFRDIVIGLYINTEEYEKPYLVIGLETNLDFNKAVAVLKEELYKHFSKFSKFEFISLDAKSELTDKLKLQGVSIHVL